MQIVDVKLGTEGDVNVQLVGGKLTLVLAETTPGLTGGVTINIPLTYFLDALKVKLNNTLVSSFIDIIEGVLSTMP